MFWEFAIQARVNNISPISSPTSLSSSVDFFFLGPKRLFISRANSPVSSVKRASISNGCQYPSLYWEIQVCTSFCMSCKLISFLLNPILVLMFSVLVANLLDKLRHRVLERIELLLPFGAIQHCFCQCYYHALQMP